ncbi:fatty acid desaturase [Diplodia corticola]|uniref:Fatty acid desaturase n=1 Tax=Diplodia corticola TaxID=236234 RepID=A0A1J9RRV6_9PEZI|nr:fatty acid desaturase [Diplodia corticola]OJD35275.1 fatty acid desaturase [Diplodia corticola]
MLPTLRRTSILSKLFGEFKAKTVVTLFHEPASASSMRVLNLVKQAEAEANTTKKDTDVEVTLDVQEEPPTSDQVAILLDYVGAKDAGKIIQGATDEHGALRKFKANKSSFVKPLIVDWGGGKVVTDDNESKILRLLKDARAGEPIPDK